MGKFKDWLTADFKSPVTELKEAYKKGKAQYDKDMAILEAKRAVEALQLRKTWHFLHFLLTILTGGLWLLVWVWRSLANSQHNRHVEHDLRRRQHELMFNQVKGKEDEKIM